MASELSSTLRLILNQQDQVVSRRQLLTVFRQHDLERWLRQRLLSPVHPGVYLGHTGSPVWRQLVWAALLYFEPAAAAGRTAIRLHENDPPRRREPIEIVVPGDRRLSELPGVWPHRRRDFRAAVLDLSPPRLRYEEAIIDRADQATGVTAIAAELAQPVGARMTTAERLQATVMARSRLRQRRLLQRLLKDIASGVHSVLEAEYVRAVERAHALPEGVRQRRVSSDGLVTYQDVAYEWLLVELDGWRFHGSAEQHDLDLERDLDSALRGQQTQRVGYFQVFDRACLTAAKLGALLRLCGWPGWAQPCAADCAVSDFRAA